MYAVDWNNSMIILANTKEKVHLVRLSESFVYRIINSKSLILCYIINYRFVCKGRIIFVLNSKKLSVNTFCSKQR